ncbi:MAG: PilZ domain-containing protein [Gemmataceae bacterium]
MPGGYPQPYPGQPGGMAMQPGGMPGYPGGMPMQPGQVPQQRRPATNPAGRGAMADASRDPLPPPPPSAAPAPAPRVMRGVRGEDRPAAPRPVARASVAIPTPEELGIGGGARPPAATRQLAQNLDWSTARAQMQQLGVVRFQLENTASGGTRFSCWVGDGAGSRLVQADGENEAEAVRTCLDRAPPAHRQPPLRSACSDESRPAGPVRHDTMPSPRSCGPVAFPSRRHPPSPSPAGDTLSTPEAGHAGRLGGSASMTVNNLQGVAEAVVRRAERQGYVVARDVREELTTAGLDDGLWKEVLALARPSLTVRRNRYYYSAPVSTRVRAAQSTQRDIEEAVAGLVQAAQAARQRVERREQGRFDFIQPVRVVAEDGREWTVLTRDLSATGIRLIAARSLLGQKLRVCIRHEGRTIEFTVRILWTCPVGDDLVENGGSFLAVQAEADVRPR